MPNSKRCVWRAALPFYKADRCGRIQELRRQFETLSELRNEVKQLQTDNLALYEKVRYLQAYSATAGGAGSSSTSAERHYPPAAVSARHQSAIRIDDDDKYRDKYQASMNPFEAFRGRVSGLCPCLASPR